MDFKLPDIGEGVAEGEIIKWHVAEGDVVKEDQLMVEVMTDKATVQITAPTSGTIRKIHFKEGEMAKVHSTLVEIAERGTEKESAKPLEPERKKKEEVKEGRREEEEEREISGERKGEGRVLAAPATRRLAREKGIDLSLIRGTGPGGRILQEDVLAALRERAGAQKEAAGKERAPQRPVGREIVRQVPRSERESREPLRGIRKRIAEHMRKSKDEAAHFSYVDEVDMTEIVQLREQIKKETEAQGVKLSFLPFVIKAAVAALKEYPMLNAMLDVEKEEIVYKYFYNIGIAVATEKGLVVPVIKNADQKNLIELARDVTSLSEKAREGKLSLEELQDGTFTITSVGSIGGLFATPIINYPEVAILGVNKIQERPVVREGGIVVRHMMYLSLSLDHRIVDGVEAAYFMNKLIGYLSNPKTMLLV